MNLCSLPFFPIPITAYRIRIDGTLTIEPHMNNALLLMGIWRLDVSSRRLERLTIGLCVLTIPLVILSIIEIWNVVSLIP